MIKQDGRRFKVGQQGVTFVEMLIVMVLLSIFLTLLAGLLTATIDSQSQTEAYSAVTTDGRYVIARLDYDIQRASAVTTPSSLGGSGSTLVLTIGGSSYTYALSGASLQLTDTTGTANLTGGGVTVSGLSFQRVGNTGGKDTVKYSFTLTGTTHSASGNNIQVFSSSAELR